MPGQRRRHCPSIEPILRFWNAMNTRNLLNATFHNYNNSYNSIQTQNVDSMLFYCWASVADSDTTLSQQRVNVCTGHSEYDSI